MRDVTGAFSRPRIAVAVLFLSLLVGCSEGGAAGSAPFPSPDDTPTIASVNQALHEDDGVPPGKTRITVRFSEYWTNDGCSADDRDYWVRVEIGGQAFYRDLDPDCCGLCESLPFGLPTNLALGRTVTSNGGTVPVRIALYENDGGEEEDGPCCGDNARDIDPTTDTALDLDVDILTGQFTGDLSSEGDCTGTGCVAGSPSSFGEGVVFQIQVQNECIGHTPTSVDGNENSMDGLRCNDGEDNDCDGLIDEDARDVGLFGDDCNGIDNDCDGQVDEDYVPGVFTEQFPRDVTCSYCQDLPVCIGGVEIGDCWSRCLPAPAVETEWLNYLFARDMDVAADRLCLVSALGPQAALYGGVLGDVLCTREAKLGSDAFYELIPTPEEFKIGLGLVSLDPLGRVWAATALGVYAQKQLLAQPSRPDLELVANAPQACAAIKQLELVGPQDRLYFGPTARPFVLCGGRLFELVPNETLPPGQQQWIDHGVMISERFVVNIGNLLPMGVSPSNAFDLFYATPPTLVNPGYFRGTAPSTALDDLGFQNSIAGGVFVLGPRYGDPLSPQQFHIGQWNGTDVVPVADLGKPREFPGMGRGKYETLIAETTEPGAASRKIVEGGGAGVGGPSPAGTIDLLWILNDTSRVYAYNIRPPAEDLSDDFEEDDVPPGTIIELFSLNNPAPQALCQGVELMADANGVAELTDPTLVDGGSTTSGGEPPDLELSTPGLFPIGTTAVTLRVSDGLASSTCTADVTVVAPTPVARCRDVGVSTSGSTAAVTPEIVDAGSTDPNAAPLTLSLSPPGPFAIGSTNVTLQVSNGTFTTDCVAKVTVVASGSGFAPDDLDPLAWYEASSSSVQLTGTGVTAWQDSSGNGQHLVQTVSTSRPQYSSNGWDGSEPAVTFDGVDDVMEYPASGGSLLSELAGEDKPFSVILTWEPLDLDADRDIVQWDNGGVDGNNSLIELRSNTTGSDEAKYRHRRGDGVTSLLNTGTVKFYLDRRTTAFIFDGTSLTIYDGAATHLSASANDRGALVLARFRLGQGDNASLHGRIAEFVVADWAVSSAIFQQYRNYAHQRWGGL